MNNKKPIEIIKNYNLKPLSIYEKDGGFGMTIQENIISQIDEARDEECYNFLIKQIQNFIVKNNIETCFVINKEEMVDCLQEHNKLYCEIKDLQHQLDQQKAMWNELKEWLEDDDTGFIHEWADQSADTVVTIYDVLEKMQELEQGEKDDI